MVNEMITEWGKLNSVEAKMAISDQINSIKDAPGPAEVFAAEHTKSQA